MKQSCLELARLGRNVTTSPDPAMVMHMRRCQVCQAEWSALKRLTLLVSSLPDPPARETARTQARARLVASAANVMPRRASLRWSGSAIAVTATTVTAVAAVLVLFLRPTSVAPPAAPKPGVAAVDRDSATARHRGDVRSRDPGPGGRGAARFTWSALPDEIVRLTQGTVSIKVSPLHAHERFRVIAGDGEVEVHGTAFDVTVDNDRLVAVTVDHGLVEVRPAKGGPVLLTAAQRWDAPPVAVTSPPAPARTVASLAPHDIGRRPHEARAGENAAERGFAEGWRALRTQDFAAAAAAFGRAAEEGRNAPIGEDAFYWQAVALARAERPIQARAAMAAFLARYPTSPRGGEISAMLGWLLIRVDDDEGARRRFNAALRDRTEVVRASARSGLAALDRRTARGKRSD